MFVNLLKTKATFVNKKAIKSVKKAGGGAYSPPPDLLAGFKGALGGREGKRLITRDK